MGIFRKIPPTATEIPLSTLNALTTARIDPRKTLMEFEETLKSYLNVRYCFLFSSGTAALCAVLQVIAENTDKNEVIMPAYTCPSVAAAVIKSGLMVRLCDIDELSFNMNLNHLSDLISERTLCIVCVHLFGIPAAVDRVKEITVPLRIPVIEDAAQTFGATVEGRRLGTLGDVGIFSFGRGKPFALMGGGAAVTNDEVYAVGLEKLIGNLEPSGFPSRVSALMRLYMYSVFICPRTYWIPNSLPFLGLGKTVFSMKFGVRKMDPLRAGLGLLLLPFNDDTNRRRLENSGAIFQGLGPLIDSSTFQFFKGAQNSVLLRLPLFVSSHKLRNRLMSLLSKRGLTGTRMYPSPINEINGVPTHFELEDATPTAKSVAEHLLTLPVHPLVSEGDLEAIVEAFVSVIETD